MEKRNIDVPILFKVSFILGNAVKYVNAKMNQKENLPKIHFLIFMLIFLKPGINQNKISLALEVDKTTLSRIIIRLKELGLVTKIMDANNRRSTILNVTKKGEALAKEFTIHLNEYKEKIFTGINKNILDQVEKTVNILLENIKDQKLTFEEEYFNF
ncbi:MarR family winged helix-turn-helix transcriptional regulator [Mesoplasma photuris]|uniref:MarR family winged helix-turn-helix transcriptional regulator n=1 Tax=Mesoplasma photuris TaxID=217731 RepID=UPI0004E0CD25|nr:MarR family winged helix-turn-helix transcriptional regulator [Mesoplasma photuris]